MGDWANCEGQTHHDYISHISDGQYCFYHRLRCFKKYLLFYGTTSLARVPGALVHASVATYVVSFF